MTQHKITNVLGWIEQEMRPKQCTSEEFIYDAPPGWPNCDTGLSPDPDGATSFAKASRGRSLRLLLLRALLSKQMLRCAPCAHSVRSQFSEMVWNDPTPSPSFRHGWTLVTYAIPCTHS